MRLAKIDLKLPKSGVVWLLMATGRIETDVAPRNTHLWKYNAAAKDSAPPPSRSFRGLSVTTSILWGVADLLRGDYTQADDGKVVMPLTVIRLMVDRQAPIPAAVTGKIDASKEGA